MEINNLSSQYFVRRLNENDVDIIFNLCKDNDVYYQYHPPFVTKDSIIADMKALPSNKDYKDKYYIGYFDGNQLVAIMDLIIDYPKSKNIFIGFFMVDSSLQGNGIGTKIIEECTSSLSHLGYQKIRLAIDKGNPQSEAFWSKNSFVKTGEEIPNGTQINIPMERIL